HDGAEPVRDRAEEPLHGGVNTCHRACAPPAAGPPAGRVGDAAAVTGRAGRRGRQGAVDCTDAELPTGHRRAAAGTHSSLLVRRAICDLRAAFVRQSHALTIYEVLTFEVRAFTGGAVSLSHGAHRLGSAREQARTPQRPAPSEGRRRALRCSGGGEPPGENAQLTPSFSMMISRTRPASA